MLQCNSTVLLIHDYPWKMHKIEVGYRLRNKLLPNKISQQLQSDSNKKSLLKTHTYNTRGKKSLISLEYEEVPI